MKKNRLKLKKSVISFIVMVSLLLICVYLTVLTTKEREKAIDGYEYTCDKITGLICASNDERVLGVMN